MRIEAFKTTHVPCARRHHHFRWVGLMSIKSCSKQVCGASFCYPEQGHPWALAAIYVVSVGILWEYFCEPLLERNWPYVILVWLSRYISFKIIVLFLSGLFAVQVFFSISFWFPNRSLVVMLIWFAFQLVPFHSTSAYCNVSSVRDCRKVLFSLSKRVADPCIVLWQIPNHSTTTFLFHLFTNFYTSGSSSFYFLVCSRVLPSRLQNISSLWSQQREKGVPFWSN